VAAGGGPAPDDGPLVVVARLGGAHGLHGELRAQPTGPTLAVLPIGSSMLATLPGGDRRNVVLRARRPTARGAILAFEGVLTREDAGALAGATVAVPEAALPELADEDGYYVRDLVGCRVVAGGRDLGEIRDVHTGPSNDALEVVGDGDTVLIPFTHDAIREVDLAGRRVEVRPDLLGG